MHMADALVSPAVGGTMWAVTGGLVLYGAARAKKHLDDKTAPLMGVMGAFVFAAQMINFAIPGTGSSGHLGGGLLLAILLGPWPAFLTIASILIVQALFFADGGILALGCNIFNLGVFPCLLAYPLIYKPLASGRPTRMRILSGSLIASILALQMGALGVVLETTLSGISELPFRAFALFMQPIHLAIGLAEGFATASIIMFLYKARPELLPSRTPSEGKKAFLRPVIACFVLASVLIGGFLSRHASTLPDGLEWSILLAAQTAETGNADTPLHSALSSLRDKAAILPDSGLAGQVHDSPGAAPSFSAQKNERLGKTASDLLGIAIFLTLGLIAAFLFRPRSPGV